jgi:hypothetical protein
LRVAYEAGASIRELEAATGQSYGWVHRHLKEAGVTLRSRGGAVRGKAKQTRIERAQPDVNWAAKAVRESAKAHRAERIAKHVNAIIAEETK